MKTIPVPKQNRRARSRGYDAMAKQLKSLPAGQGVPFSGTEEDRVNLYRRMQKRGIVISTARVSNGEYAVWIDDTQ